jgi:hypothetical protein
MFTILIFDCKHTKNLPAFEISNFHRYLIRSKIEFYFNVETNIAS